MILKLFPHTSEDKRSGWLLLDFTQHQTFIKYQAGAEGERSEDRQTVNTCVVLNVKLQRLDSMFLCIRAVLRKHGAAGEQHAGRPIRLSLCLQIPAVLCSYRQAGLAVPSSMRYDTSTSRRGEPSPSLEWHFQPDLLLLRPSSFFPVIHAVIRLVVRVIYVLLLLLWKSSGCTLLRVLIQHVSAACFLLLLWFILSNRSSIKGRSCQGPRVPLGKPLFNKST